MIAAVFNVVKYISVGLLIWCMGVLFFGDSLHFASHSEPARLRVLDVEARRDSDGYMIYRPVFVLDGAQSAGKADGGKPWAGKSWTRPARHQSGEIVSGRYDAESGEMRSDKMIGMTAWLGRFAQVLGILVGLQALAILFGFPEQHLPLRIQIGVRRRPRSIWL